MLGFGRTILTLVAVVGVAATAFAQADVIKARQELMKLNGQATRLAAPILRGEQPYDAAKAKEAFDLLARAAAGFADKFPPGSDKGAETEASPAIWTDNAGFRAAVAKFEADVTAQAPNADKGLDAFRVAFTAVTQNCRACHQKYRIQK